MRRFEQRSGEGAERLALMSADAPSPGAKEVLIRPRFIGLNFKDVKQLEGKQTASSVGAGLPGIEVSGTVVKAGPESAHPPGARVVARTSGGGLAELVCAGDAEVIDLGPDAREDLLRDSAASLVALTTASILLEEMARIRPDESLLVHGAAGGVGSALGLLARHLGVKSRAGVVGREEKRSAALGVGFTDVFRRENFDVEVKASLPRGIDVIADPIGGETRLQSLSLLAPLGRLLAYGRTGTDDEGDPGAFELRRRSIAVMGMTNGHLVAQAPHLVRAAAKRSIDRVRAGMTVPIFQIFPFEDAPAAIEALASGSTVGKVLVELAH